MRKVISTLCVLVFLSVMNAYTGSGVSPSQVYDTLDPTVNLLTPLAGEIWYVGEVMDITWNAFDTNLVADSILIHYSLDGGASYIPITGPVYNTGSYSFQIPEHPSDLASIRIMAKDSFGNYTRVSNQLIWADALPQATANVLIRISGDDAVIEWDPVSQNVYDHPISVDGYMLFEGSYPYQNPDDYELLAITPDNYYTYENAAGSYERKFFYVVAYKGDIGRLAIKPDDTVIGQGTHLRMGVIRQYLKARHQRGKSE